MGHPKCGEIPDTVPRDEDNNHLFLQSFANSPTPTGHLDVRHGYEAMLGPRTAMGAARCRLAAVSAVGLVIGLGGEFASEFPYK